MRVQKEPDDTVMVWPHLLSIEFFAAAMISVFLLLMGLFANAPLEDLANGNVTPASENCEAPSPSTVNAERVTLVMLSLMTRNLRGLEVW